MRTALCGLLFCAVVPGAQATPETPEARGWKVLERALKAAGGRDLLAAVKDLSRELQTHVILPQGDFDVPSKISVILPDTARQESTLPVGTTTAALSRSGGWMKRPGGVSKIPDAELGRMLADLDREYILFHPPADRSAVRWLRDETVDSRPCDLIELAKVSGTPLLLAVDRQTGQVVRKSYRAEAPGGAVSDVEEFHSDFRAVEGRTFAFKVRVMRDGKLARESVTRSLKINTGLQAQELLTQPQP